jgi:hypothetical protein
MHTKDLWPCAACWAGRDHAGRTSRGGTGVGCWFRLDLWGVMVTSAGKAAQADVACIGKGKTLRQAGHRMRELGVAALAVCGEDGQYQGVISRDMVVQSIAAGGDPKTVTVGEVASYAPVPPRRSRQAGPLPDAEEGAGDALRQRLAITG